MDVNIQHDDQGRYIIQCPAEMEWTARVDLVSILTEQVGEDQIRGIILDLGSVTYINSAGLGALFALRKYGMESGAAVVIARPRPTIERMLKTVNLPELIPVVATLNEARERIEQELTDSQDGS